MFITSNNIQDMLNRMTTEEKDKKFQEMVSAFCWFKDNGDRIWGVRQFMSVSAMANAALMDVTEGY